MREIQKNSIALAVWHFVAVLDIMHAHDPNSFPVLVLFSSDENLGTVR